MEQVQRDSSLTPSTNKMTSSSSSTYLDVRVFSKRTLGTSLVFIDAIAVLDDQPRVVELCLPGNLVASKVTKHENDLLEMSKPISKLLEIPRDSRPAESIRATSGCKKRGEQVQSEPALVSVTSTKEKADEEMKNEEDVSQTAQAQGSDECTAPIIPSMLNSTRPSSASHSSTKEDDAISTTGEPKPKKMRWTEQQAALNLKKKMASEGAAASDIKVGDVLRLSEFRRDAADPRLPRIAILNVTAFAFLEPWADTFVGQKVPFPFHPPVWFAEKKQEPKRSKRLKETKIKPLLGQEDPSMATNASIALGACRSSSSCSPPSPLGYRRPAMILQCHLPQAERVAEYFQGVVASNCTKDRLVYVFDDDGNENQEENNVGQEKNHELDFKKKLLTLRRQFISKHAHHEAVENGSEASTPSTTGLSLSDADVPTFFRSVIHRIYFVDYASKPFVSLKDCLAYLGSLRGWTEDPRTTERKTLCFPKEIETILFQKRLAEFQKLNSNCVGSTTRGGGSASSTSSAEVAECKTNRATAVGGAGEKTEDEENETPLLEQDILKILSTAPVSSVSCDSVCYADGLYFVGTNVPRVLIPERAKQAVPSAAYWKLLEIRDRYLSKNGGAGVSSYSKRNLAIDLGASPGGWSFCLAREFGTRRVLAVDPAAHMHDMVREILSKVVVVGGDKKSTSSTFISQQAATGVIEGHQVEIEKPDGVEEDKSTAASSPASSVASESKTNGTEVNEASASSSTTAGEARKAIEHWRMRSDDALAKLAAKHSMGSMSEAKIAVFVCDMNDEPEKNAEQFAVAARSNLLEAHCLVVLTMKNVYRSRGEFAEKVAVCKKRLEGEELRLKNVEEIHLFANTRLETTLVGEWFG
ncbi:unnamed protein product [Amoebophrya sp. A25]|nr:unnamed protein product [Amoebophrya sp. A25]|eukprot:GSA25T00009789001.1